ncbi:MAG: hypothetical protein J6S67_21535 [Methanobrevibacter sp.]|nr:hypothetical protein [Methanobrevibacter sp.]
MSINTISLLDREPFKRMISTVGNLPTSFVDSLSYYEVLAWLCQYVTETIIPKINEDSEAINALQEEFIALREEVEEAIKEIPQLRADFIELSEKFDQTLIELQAQYDAFKIEVQEEINTQIAQARTAIMEVVNAYFETLNDKIDDEVERIDEKFNTWAIANTIVFNTLRGTQTTLQVYLDDLSGVNRTDAITATEYDELELTATEYDAYDMSAHDYDYYAKTILTA